MKDNMDYLKPLNMEYQDFLYYNLVDKKDKPLGITIGINSEGKRVKSTSVKSLNDAIDRYLSEA